LAKISPSVASAAHAHDAASLRSKIARWALDSLDTNHAVGVNGDDGAHLLQDSDEVHDLWFDCGTGKFCLALGANRGEQHLLGGPNARVWQ